MGIFTLLCSNFSERNGSCQPAVEKPDLESAYQTRSALPLPERRGMNQPRPVLDCPRDEEANLVIEPVEAVKRIYREYLEGANLLY